MSNTALLRLLLASSLLCLAYFLQDVRAAGGTLRVSVVLRGGEDSQKQGTTDSMSVDGAKEGCPASINFPSRK